MCGINMPILGGGYLYCPSCKKAKMKKHKRSYIKH